MAWKNVGEIFSLKAAFAAARRDPKERFIERMQTPGGGRRKLHLAPVKCWVTRGFSCVVYSLISLLSLSVFSLSLEFLLCPFFSLSGARSLAHSLTPSAALS